MLQRSFLQEVSDAHLSLFFNGLSANFHAEYSVYPSRTLTRILHYCPGLFGLTVSPLLLPWHQLAQLHHSFSLKQTQCVSVLGGGGDSAYQTSIQVRSVVRDERREARGISCSGKGKWVDRMKENDILMLKVKGCFKKKKVCRICWM